VESVLDACGGCGNSYQIDWSESHRDKQGTLERTEKWRAYATVALSPPKDETAAMQNPLGLFVTGVSWAKVQTQ
jgi:type IV secretion system protein VirB5